MLQYSEIDSMLIDWLLLRIKIQHFANSSSKLYVKYRISYFLWINDSRLHS